MQASCEVRESVVGECPMGNDNPPGIQNLKIAAYIVIVAHGIQMASHFFSILLLSLLLT